MSANPKQSTTPCAPTELELALAVGSTAERWLPMTSAPKNCTHVRVLMKEGTVHEDAHWASDLSGEDQPPFEGWFIPVKDSQGKTAYYCGIPKPKAWMPSNEKLTHGALAPLRAANGSVLREDK